MSAVRVVRYCLCGASLRGSSSPAGLANGIAAMFDREHTGEGHGSATPRQAARARARAEAEHLSWDGTP